MPARPEIKIDDKQMRLAFARAGRDLQRAYEKGLRTGLQSFKREWLPKVKTTPLRKLARQVFKVQVRDGRGRLRPTRLHATMAQQNRARTVRPKRGEFLAFPHPRVRAGGKTPPGYATPRTFQKRFGRSRLLIRKGRVLLEIRKQGRASVVVGPAFILRKSVRQKDLLRFTATWTRPDTQRRFFARVEKALRASLTRNFGSRSVERAS